MNVDNIHPDFFKIKKCMYDTLGWECKNIHKDPESAEYGACSFNLNDHRIIFRVGKITPTKMGQFVTFWKRIGNKPIMPYDMVDQFDFFMVVVRNQDHFGLFVFPKEVLYAKGIISKDGKGGKRAMRIYPAWDVADNSQAKKTQAWQLSYFFEIKVDKSNDALIKLFI